MKDITILDAKLKKLLQIINKKMAQQRNGYDRDKNRMTV